VWIYLAWTLKKAFKVSNDGVVVSLNYKNVKLTFDRIIHATDGCVTGFLMKPILSKNINGFANASISNERINNINHFHKLFGHCSQDKINKTIKMYDFKSSGSFDTCEQWAIAKAQQKNVNNKTIKMYGFKSSGCFDTSEQCAIAKAWQKNVTKNWLGSSIVPGERFYVVIGSMKERSFGGAKFGLW
jgi:hypothetical protein